MLPRCTLKCPQISHLKRGVDGGESICTGWEACVNGDGNIGVGTGVDVHPLEGGKDRKDQQLGRLEPERVYFLPYTTKGMWQMIVPCALTCCGVVE